MKVKKEYLIEISNMINVSSASLKAIEEIHSFHESLKKLEYLKVLTEKAVFDFNKSFDRFFSFAKSFEESGKINQLELVKIKKYFRQLNLKLFQKSAFTKRGIFKPRGYPGDFRMLEAMYDNVISSQGIGALLDKRYVDDFYVKAVRDRKDYLKAILIDLIDVNKKNDKVNFPYLADLKIKNELNVLNVACGGCREFREIFRERIPVSKKINVFLLDKDPLTINFVKKSFKSAPKQFNFKYLEKDVLDVDKLISSSNIKFDLIYSIGLADYLPDSIIRLMVDKCSKMLKSGGVFVLAHKNVPKFSSTISDWVCDWKFIPRTPQHLKRLVVGSLNKGFNIKITYQQSKAVFYFFVKKNA